MLCHFLFQRRLGVQPVQRRCAARGWIRLWERENIWRTHAGTRTAGQWPESKNSVERRHPSRPSGLLKLNQASLNLKHLDIRPWMCLMFVSVPETVSSWRHHVFQVVPPSVPFLVNVISQDRHQGMSYTFDKLSLKWLHFSGQRSNITVTLYESRNNIYVEIFTRKLLRLVEAYNCSVVSPVSSRPIGSSLGLRNNKIFLDLLLDPDFTKI